MIIGKDRIWSGKEKGIKRGKRRKVKGERYYRGREALKK